ncbi:hypothetical protein BD626DRAFT_575305 [Schizophyllum amplum]|uniref:D-xylose 1-dehydrogenase (NADP(+), D-xylono-1,5-lactone-forming) n=1 Tax=Schizophyllum amplum TaxID=97359 RepID=A0A550BVZ7_9AGAR|nr:hypothetical protein BD626DRAFT_575305 [Auriculariopsis ampla]
MSNTVSRVYKGFYPTEVPKARAPVRFGIHGAAAIVPLALANPAKTHPEVATKALAAGKHVLCEKPLTNTAEEVREMFAFAEEKNLVLSEAFTIGAYSRIDVHIRYFNPRDRFHLSIQRAKAILESGELGAGQSTDVDFTLPSGMILKNDIRGALMDMGCYALNATRYLTGADPTAVLAASHGPPPFPTDGPVDERTTVNLAFPYDTTGVYHNIHVRPKGKAARTDSGEAYTFAALGVEAKGEDRWLTYVYQLEAFVDKLKGRTPQTWVSKEDSITNMQWIENVYEKGGYGARPRSEFKLPA